MVKSEKLKDEDFFKIVYCWGTFNLIKQGVPILLDIYPKICLPFLGYGVSMLPLSVGQSALELQL